MSRPMHQTETPTGLRSAVGEPRRWPVYLAVVALTVVCYAPTLWNGFIYDDHSLIVENPRLRLPGIQGYLYLLNPKAYDEIDGKSMDYRPPVHLMTRVELQLWGVHPFPFRITNLALNIAVCLLAVHAAFLLGFERTAVLAAGLLYAAHPARTEAVAWIKGLAELLAALFALSALVLHLLRWRGPFRWGRELLLGSMSLAALLLALLCKKGTLAIIPVGVLAPWLLREGRYSKREFAWAVALAAVGILYVWVDRTWLTPRRIYGTGEVELHGVRHLWALAYTVPFYLSKAFWPVRLSVMHQFPAIWKSGNPWTDTPGIVWGAGLAWTVFIAATVAVIVYRKKYPRICLGWLWFVFGLLPIANLILITGRRLALQRLYLPLFGLALVAGVILAALCKTRFRWACVVALVVVLCAMTARTIRQHRYWADDETLWLYEKALHPDSPIPPYCLGLWIFDEGDYATAEAYLVEALALAPERTDVRGALGLTRYRGGDVEGAIAFLQESLAAFSWSNLLRDALSRLLISEQRYDEAEVLLRDRVENSPHDAMYRAQYAVVLEELERYAEAEAELRSAVKERPEMAVLHRDLAWVLEKRGKNEEAAREYRKAIETDVGGNEARRNLFRLLRRMGRTEEAIDEGIRLAEAGIREATFANNLAYLIAESTSSDPHRLALAEELAREAVSLTEEKDPFFLDTLAVVLRRADREEEARKYERAAIQALQNLPPSPPRDRLLKELATRDEP